MAGLTSGGLRSLILFHGVPSIFEAFRDRPATIEVPRTLAADRTTKVKTIPIPKKTAAAAAEGAAINEAETAVGGVAVLVDLGEAKKPASSYGAVFTSEPDNGPCWYCRRDVKPETKVGIPLRIRDDRFHHLLIVDTEGRACNTSCAFKFVKEHASEHSCYEGRETAMQQINEICAPGTKLIAAPNWRLHKMNGGPMTDEEFDREVRTFVPTSNLQFRMCSLTFGPS
jgi:hypothetical protein